MADDTSAADAGHDEGALHDAEEKMQLRPDGTEDAHEEVEDRIRRWAR